MIRSILDPRPLQRQHGPGQAMGYQPNLWGESEDPQIDRAIDLPSDPNYHYYPEEFYGKASGEMQLAGNGATDTLRGGAGGDMIQDRKAAEKVLFQSAPAAGWTGLATALQRLPDERVIGLANALSMANKQGMGVSVAFNPKAAGGIELKGIDKRDPAAAEKWYSLLDQAGANGPEGIKRAAAAPPVAYAPTPPIAPAATAAAEQASGFRPIALARQDGGAPGSAGAMGRSLATLGQMSRPDNGTLYPAGYKPPGYQAPAHDTGRDLHPGRGMRGKDVAGIQRQLASVYPDMGVAVNGHYDDPKTLAAVKRFQLDNPWTGTSLSKGPINKADPNFPDTIVGPRTRRALQVAKGPDLPDLTPGPNPYGAPPYNSGEMAPVPGSIPPDNYQPGVQAGGPGYNFTITGAPGVSDPRWVSNTPPQDNYFDQSGTFGVGAGVMPGAGSFAYTPPTQRSVRTSSIYSPTYNPAENPELPSNTGYHPDNRPNDDFGVDLGNFFTNAGNWAQRNITSPETGVLGAPGRAVTRAFSTPAEATPSPDESQRSAVHDALFGVQQAGGIIGNAFSGSPGSSGSGSSSTDSGSWDYNASNPAGGHFGAGVPWSTTWDQGYQDYDPGYSDYSNTGGIP